MPARLGVERRAVKNDFAFFAFAQLVLTSTVLDDAIDYAIARLRLFVPNELRMPCRLNLHPSLGKRHAKHPGAKGLIDTIRGIPGSTLPRRPRPLPLALHFGLIAFAVNGEAIVFDDVFYEIRSKPERVMELK